MSASKQMPMQTPEDLFVHELSGMQQAEKNFVKMLEEAQGLVQNQQLQEGLRMHAEQSRQHEQRIQQILQQLGQKPHPVKCHAAQGLHQDLKDALPSQPSTQVLEGLVVDGAAKTEHYEIAAYTGLIEKARALGQTEAAQLLQQNLQDEQQMLRQVEQLSRQMTQQMAAMGDVAMSQQPSATAL